MIKYIALQLILFIPLYLVWKNDYKTIGKDNLAIGLGQRFIAWLVFVLIWAIPVIKRI